ncbi:Filamin-interacting protein FAM101B [Sciurus carolinensis]|uniref:Filamin-interacting protein FAM101B n=1 Tax=Sciurus carolinensis TaxID=30640 RepID=A0AA41T0V3_SCICA|nr:Filamin-interacting protein FAM101B [Sciurus carolinensis]
MVRRLSLQDVPELVDTKKKGDGVLDSLDSGLSPSPGLASAGVEAAAGSAPIPEAGVPCGGDPSVLNPASLPSTLAHKPTRFLSTTFVYPKFPKTIYTTTLEYNCPKKLRRFLSSVELEATEFLGSDCLLDEC